MKLTVQRFLLIAGCFVFLTTACKNDNSRKAAKIEIEAAEEAEEAMEAGMTAIEGRDEYMLNMLKDPATGRIGVCKSEFEQS
jgi:hypothetical protein